MREATQHAPDEKITACAVLTIQEQPNTDRMLQECQKQEHLFTTKSLDNRSMHNAIDIP